MKFPIFLLFAGMVITNAIAGNSDAPARSSGWQRLLVYAPDNTSRSGVRSAILDNDFFLSPHGKTDPKAELAATLAAMLLPVGETPDHHAKCRFPARLIWLRSHYPEYREQLADIECPEFKAWSNPADIESVSLVFANGYLGNPASYYGHLLLKFNQRKTIGKSHLLDPAVNFGAIQDKQDDPISYIVKGITGGYEGGFTTIEFYFHTANYGEIELRDLWEYRLSLPPESVRYIVSHAWEVLKRRYVYYFFHDNCAFRVAELLQVVDGIDVTPRNRPWIIPQAVIQKLDESRFGGEPLIAEKIHHPSRQSRLYAKYRELSAEEKELAVAIVEKRIDPQSEKLTHLAMDRRQRLIDTVLDYHQFALERNKVDGGKTSPDYADVLRARFALPPGDAAQTSDKPHSPEDGHSPGWIQLAATQNSQGRNLQSLRIRPAYYDVLDAGNAQVKNSALSMGEVQIEFGYGPPKLRKLDVIAIDSMNPAVTGLPGDRGKGWRIRVGAEQDRLTCQNCLVTRAQGDIGVGKEFTGNFFAAVHLGGAIQERTALNGPGFARVGLTMLLRPREDVAMRFNREQRMTFSSETRTYAVDQFEARWALGRSHDLRILWENDRLHRLTLGIGTYW